MNIIIDNKSGKPIYEQIYTQLKEQIIGGDLEADAPLPSIRSLAKDLRISVITTKRADDELEKEGGCEGLLCRSDEPGAGKGTEPAEDGRAPAGGCPAGRDQRCGEGGRRGNAAAGI